MTEIKSGKRDLSLDIVRSLAIMLVVLCHVDKSPLPDWLEMPLKAAALLGVPLFVILTGYLMLDRDYTGEYLGKYVKRNLLPILAAYELWNMIWCIARQVMYGFDSSELVRHAKIALFIGDTGSSFWYMQLVVGLYLGIPLLAQAIGWLERRAGRAYLFVLFAAAAYFGLVVPTFQQFNAAFGWDVTVTGVIDMNLFGARVWGGSVWVLYLLFGYSAKRLRGVVQRRGFLLVMLLVSWALCAAVVWLQMARGTYSAAYGSILVALPSACIFGLLLTVDWGRLRSPGLSRMAYFLSTRSFGVYMVHALILDKLMAGLGASGVVLSPVGSIAVMAIVFVSSYLVVQLLSFIPLTRVRLLLIK